MNTVDAFGKLEKYKIFTVETMHFRTQSFYEKLFYVQGF